MKRAGRGRKDRAEGGETRRPDESRKEGFINLDDPQKDRIITATSTG